MRGLMTPNNPTVELGNILNLVTRDEEGRLTYRNYLVAHAFDYRTVLEDVRAEGIYKTEEVYERLSQLLVERHLVLEAESAVLDLGVIGRASEAVIAVYKDKLNDQAKLVDQIVEVLQNNCFTFEGPEGDLHVMKVDEGNTLGYVKLAVSCSRNIERWITLDIVGPPAADFPHNLQEQIQATLMQYVADRYPDEYLALRAYVGRSELAQALDILIGDNSCVPTTPKKRSHKLPDSSAPPPSSPLPKSPYPTSAPVICVRKKSQPQVSA